MRTVRLNPEYIAQEGSLTHVLDSIEQAIGARKITHGFDITVET
jgi:hypothetical protein